MRGPAALERSVLDSVATKVLRETISNEKFMPAPYKLSTLNVVVLTECTPIE